MIRYPLDFKVEASSDAPINTTWTSKSHLDLPPIPTAIPPEFQGPGGGYSPEDLFGLAILNCLIAMFKVLCARSKASFETINGTATITIDRDSKGTPAITKVAIDMNITGSSDSNQIKELFEQTKKYCLVSNAVKVEIAYNLNIT